jgi:hypothetical protein
VGDLNIRFAAIPKCGSMTLRAMDGLLGEFDPDWKHSPIRAYPNWEQFHWMAVERPAVEWYPSYWAELVRFRTLGQPDPFVDALSLSLVDMEADLAVLQNPPEIGPVVRPYGVNGWVPLDFDSRYAEARARGLDFYAFCREVILDGVVCESIALSDLDAWLVAHGFQPSHENARGG